MLPIASIEVDAKARLRPVSEAGVESLIASIKELGVIKDPIHVRRKGRGEDATLALMAGGHRLEAARRLGWETIPARVWTDVTDDFARLMEIDDNLSGADLSNLELSVFLAERKRVYERLHPETRNGANGGRGGKRNETEIISFSKSVAEKRELSARHIRNFVRIGSTLSPREVAELSAIETPPKLKDLMALAKIVEPIIRADVVGRLVSGESKSVTEALDVLQPKRTPPVRDKVDEAYLAMFKLWSRAPKAAKRRFVDDRKREIAAILDDLQGV
ncbi:MAG: chromosome partitioning protein ParB [Rhodobacterales bacterium]|nr:MAG: chromosome partitioning protein ParB [Rhodobacterales bacterium]